MEEAFKRLRAIDAATKPPQAEADWIAATEYYEDRSRKSTIIANRDLGVGLADNAYPLEVGLLRRIIDRIAVVYSAPATRWLRRKNKRLAESNKDHQAMVAALRRAQYDLAWSRIEKVRSLHRVDVLRFYASDARGSVVLRVFEPFNVLREPDPSAADSIDSDRQFALLLSKSGEAETWEHWQKVSDGWIMQLVNEKGEALLTSQQPFAATDLVNPYGELPVQMLYDELPQGRAWLPPRASRTSWPRAINAIANDLWSLVTHQAHSRIITKSDNPAEMPALAAHGGTLNLNKNDSFEVHTPDPRIAECKEVLEDFAKLWSLSEDLPAAEFDKSKQVLTGAALLVQERALLARREAQIPLALEDERIAYRKFRAVHNVHTRGGPDGPVPTWDLAELAEDTELEVEVADITEPIDAKALQDAAYRDIAIGACSIIDYIQRRDGVPRHVAIETYARVQEDRLTYPAAAEVTEGAGPQAATPNDTPAEADADASPQAAAELADEAEGMGTAERLKKPSVVAAIQQ